MTDLNPANTFRARPVIFAGQAESPNWKKLADFSDTPLDEKAGQIGEHGVPRLIELVIFGYGR
jgi:hypothetical protein